MTRELLNTLYVMTPGANVRLESETLRVVADGATLLRAPLQHLGSVVLFGGASITAPAMERCVDEGRSVTMLDFAGRFRCRVVGPVSGNVLLRKAQYDAHADEARTAGIARAIIAAKIRNSRQTLLRAARDARYPADAEALRGAGEEMAKALAELPAKELLDEVRGVEGQAASAYFEVFGRMISAARSEFSFLTRTRRPPRDRVNALLSFLYALLTGDCVGACEGVGLDPQFGFLHALRPGRASLALDLAEELRSPLVDRLALTLINRKQLQASHFEERDGGSVLLSEAGRRIVLAAYQKRKQEEIAHELMKEKVPFGLVAHLQARLLARHLRGDLPEYVPFLAS
jgi:CRISPR-associated protein Cas1